MRLLFLIVLSCTLSKPLHAQIVNIPDANFKNALLNHVPVINTNGDGEIQVSEAAAFTGTLDIYYKNIADLTGLNAFTNITGLLCGSNSLSTTFTLPNFPFLQTVDCSGNFFPNIQLGSLPALVKFSIDNCNFLDQNPLVFSNLQSLKTISGVFSSISSVSLNNLPNLTSIDFKFSLRGGALNLNNLPSLYKADCSWGGLTSISTTGTTALKELICFMNNNLSSISLSNPGALEKLLCSRGKLTSLPAGLTGLRVLNCSENLLTTVSLNNATLLDSVNVSNNVLSSLVLTNKPSLQALFCSYNQLSSLTLSNLPKLKRLDCNSNLLTGITMSGYDSLRTINCSENQLTNLSLSNLPSLVEIYAPNNNLTSLSVTNFPALVFLYCNQNLLTSLSVNNLPSLTYLVCSNNQLPKLPLNHFPSLTQVQCADNLISHLDLSGTAVVGLSCQGNPGLTYINLKNNTITANPTITVSGLTQLQSVCVDDAESVYINSLVNAQLPGQNVSISSFCGFTPAGNYNTIEGNVRFDLGMNGCNNLDSTMSYVKIDITDGAQSGTTFTNYSGNYKFFSQSASNILTTDFPGTWFSVSPPAHTVNFAGYGNTAIADFCTSANGIHPDLDVVLLPISDARPGFDASYRLIYTNKGNQELSGTINLSFDAGRISFLNATPPPANQTPGNLNWLFINLSPYQTGSIDIRLHVNPPPLVNGGDLLSFLSTIYPVSGDETPGDNIFTLNQTVVNAWDPNDKLVTEGDRISIDKAGDFLHYIIRFQNTGTANALSVIVKDSLTANLNWDSFSPVSASHPFRTVIEKGNKVEFIFDGINLPGKDMNEPASHGFIAYKIKPKTGIAPGETIYNKAAIYFDFNQPVITNTVSTTVIKPGNTTDALGLTVFPNPVKDHLSFMVNPGIVVTAVRVYSSAGTLIYSETIRDTGISHTVDTRSLPPGLLFLEVISTQGKSVKKIVKGR